MDEKQSLDGSICYRAFSKSKDYAGQRMLFAASFPEATGAVLSDDHYKWKFESFPSNIKSYQYVANETEQVVGYYAAIPFIYKIEDKYRICGMVCDVMTSPERRGKGIFTKIGKYATDDLGREHIAFTTGYPIRPEVIPGHLKVGWKIIQKMPMYLRPLGIGSFLPKPIRWISMFLNPVVKLMQFWTYLPSKEYQIKFLSREEFLKSPEYDSFLEKWLQEQQNALVKSKEFLSWRTGAPETDYNFVVLKRAKQWVGVSLARSTNLRGIDALAILDIMILKEHFKGARILHQGLFFLAGRLKRDVIVCITNTLWAKKYSFLKSFYFATPAVFSLIVKKLATDLDDALLFSPERWHLFWIDSDDL